MKRVYLSGPISGLSYDDCTDWRKRFANLLQPDVVPLSPMRGKEYLKSKDTIKDSYTAVALSRAEGITAKDRNDVQNCDAMVINLLGAERISIGTVIEVGWADAFRKPIVLVLEPDGTNTHEHCIINTVCGFRVGNIEEAANIVNILLSDQFAITHQ